MSRKRLSHEELLRIVELCRGVEKRGVDPFEVDVKSHLETLKKHLPQWKLIDELVMDGEALNRLSGIVKLQSDWVRRRASFLHVDPLLIELKVKTLPPEELGEALIGSWHPVIVLDTLSPPRLKESMDYWNALLPLKERLRGYEPVKGGIAGLLDMEELRALRALSDEEFDERLKSLQEEIGERRGGRIDYWSFVRGGTHDETITRAYLLTFLVSDGQVALEFDPIEERVSLIPEIRKGGQPRSLAIAINPESLGRGGEDA